ncbi:MAG: helix-turn-helix domain-containing protein [Treponema sp.]|nr:helix-turn-helix domain-containing protein [Treponema sp.]
MSLINIKSLYENTARMLKVYCKALDCQAAIMDSNGNNIKAPELQSNIGNCDLCNIKCLDIHQKALSASRRMNETYIYTCEAGFVYWTCPLYKDGRYAGAIIAGHISILGNKTVTEENHRIPKNIKEKNHTEIQAMAHLLKICAEEISKSGENNNEIFSRLALQKNEQNEKRKPDAPDRAAENIPNTEYPMDKERTLLAAFRRGDNETGRRILNEIMENIGRANPQDLEIFRYRVIELAVLLSRAAVSKEENNRENMFEINNRYLRKVLESKNTEELTDSLHLIAERMSGKLFSFQGVRHASVLLKAERYIWENYTRKLSLEEISEAAGLSAPYFSTIFKEEMGENLSVYLNRLRVEKARVMLTETGKTLNEISKFCGFEDPSWFSKIFKNIMGISPGKYRKKGEL